MAGVNRRSGFARNASGRRPIRRWIDRPHLAGTFWRVGGPHRWAGHVYRWSRNFIFGVPMRSLQIPDRVITQQLNNKLASRGVRCAMPCQRAFEERRSHPIGNRSVRSPERGRRAGRHGSYRRSPSHRPFDPEAAQQELGPHASGRLFGLEERLKGGSKGPPKGEGSTSAGQ